MPIQKITLLLLRPFAALADVIAEIYFTAPDARRFHSLIIIKQYSW